MAEEASSYENDGFEEYPRTSTASKNENDKRVSAISKTKAVRNSLNNANTVRASVAKTRKNESVRQYSRANVQNLIGKSANRVAIDPALIADENKQPIRKGTGIKKPKLQNNISDDEFDETKTNWKHYHTMFPVSNKFLAKKWDDITRKKYLQKLGSIENSVDNNAPLKFAHLKTNLKRVQMEQERQTTIKKNNKILIEKMTDITKHDRLFAQPTEHSRNLQIAIKNNRSSRKAKIYQENLSILNRLEHSKSDYDHEKIKHDSVAHLHLLQNLATFPVRYAKLLKEGVERNFGEKKVGNIKHARHHWHGCYGGVVVPHSLEMMAFGEKDTAVKGRGKTLPTVPKIEEGEGPLVQESSPISPI
ncbi:Ubiquitin-protein ligase [Physocladia obscura]|uniref:Ubiquitin-protein ligase n=1 Tax=Physocladia obscura TaxID=109957 RepID=A0AAD5T8I3_9FUNG|nr:Ubiquitin-protein ligase [Physocladia obscura]